MTKRQYVTGLVVAAGIVTLAGGLFVQGWKLRSLQEGIALLEGARGRWADATKLASVTPRIGLAGPLADLQRLHRELAALDLPGELAPAAELERKAEAAEIEGYLGFMGGGSLGDLLAAPHLEEAAKWRRQEVLELRNVRRKYWPERVRREEEVERAEEGKG